MQPVLLKKFNKNDQPIVNKTNDWFTRARRNEILTPFLNPREKEIVYLLAKSENLFVYSFENDSFEMTRLMISQSELKQTEIDYQVVLIEIEYSMEYSVLHHSTILGSLIHNGIQRDQIGDVITDGTRWQFFVTAPVAKLILNQIDEIGRQKVRFRKREIFESIFPINEWTEKEITVSSLRIDNLIKAVFQISREEAKKLVIEKQVKVNWSIEDKPTIQVNNELLSVRHFGRFQVIDYLGKTNKQKNRIKVKILNR